jgi:hypothetical protein
MIMQRQETGLGTNLMVPTLQYTEPSVDARVQMGAGGLKLAHPHSGIFIPYTQGGWAGC